MMLFDFGFGQAENSYYQIDRSLRFDYTGPNYLTRTNSSSPTNNKIGTLSFWFKRGVLTNGTGNQQWFLETGTGASDDTYFGMFFGNTTDYLHANMYSTGPFATNMVFRDPSAWYHVVVAYDSAQATATNRIKLYVNGTQVTSFSAWTDVPLNTNWAILNSGQQINIGRHGSVSRPYDGYMAEIHLIDGTALTPTSFGEFDTNGVWRPIRVSGLTYGTNGFYLPFSDNTSTTTLGYDESGNNNDWTLNNFSVTAGAGNDSLEDTPTNNWCVLNRIMQSSATFSNGNLVASAMGANRVGPATGTIYGSIDNADGYYFELTIDSIGGGFYAGIIQSGQEAYNTNPASGGQICAINNAGDVYFAGAFVGSFTSFTSADVLQFWFSDGDLFIGKSGTPMNSGAAVKTGLTGYWTAYANHAASSGSGGVTANFGQRAFAYDPPTGFSALCTANLPTPDIANPGAYMNAVTYTGNGTAIGSGGLAVTGVGFQPDFVWIKNRDATDAHMLFDSVRGVTKYIESNTTDDEATDAESLTTFGADGFTVGNNVAVNTNTEDYVGWCWREGVTPGFDVVTYTGTGVARTISHNLGTTPKLIIVKARSTASTDQGWPVYHASNTTAPATDYLLLNSTAATADLDTIWNDTAPTTTVFSVGTNALVNALNDSYVAYLFAEVEGFSKFGLYTGNANADGPFVWCGFRPEYILFKNTGGVADWAVHDTARETFNVSDARMEPNTSNAEQIGSAQNIDILSNGFKVRTSDSTYNQSSTTIIFAAFASQPFSAPSNAR